MIVTYGIDPTENLWTQLWKKTKKYYLKLMEPNGIGKEDKILDDISQDGDNDERLPAIVVRERSSKQSENNCRQALKETIVSLMRIVL